MLTIKAEGANSLIVIMFVIFCRKALGDTKHKLVITHTAIVGFCNMAPHSGSGQVSFARVYFEQARSQTKFGVSPLVELSSTARKTKEMLRATEYASCTN